MSDLIINKHDYNLMESFSLPKLDHKLLIKLHPHDAYGNIYII